MPKDTTPGKPTTRRYSDREKADAVRMVRALRAELGTEHGTVQRVASQLGYGTESVRLWVRQADIDDGHAPGVTSQEATCEPVVTATFTAIRRHRRQLPVTQLRHELRGHIARLDIDQGGLDRRPGCPREADRPR